MLWGSNQKWSRLVLGQWLYKLNWKSWLDSLNLSSALSKQGSVDGQRHTDNGTVRLHDCLSSSNVFSPSHTFQNLWSFDLESHWVMYPVFRPLLPPQFSGVMSYCVSKAALDQFTRCCALGKCTYSFWIIARYFRDPLCHLNFKSSTHVGLKSIVTFLAIGTGIDLSERTLFRGTETCCYLLLGLSSALFSLKNSV